MTTVGITGTTNGWTDEQRSLVQLVLASLGSAIDGKLRAAANLSLAVVGGRVGEELRHVLWIYYNTDRAKYLSGLADAILAARPSRQEQA